MPDTQTRRRRRKKDTPDIDPKYSTNGYPVMLSPEMIRPAYVTSGKVQLYHEIVPVDKNGYAYPKTEAAVTALKFRGFSEVSHAVSK